MSTPSPETGEAGKEEKPRKKIDVKTALSMIPPASQLFGEQKKPRERRIRLRFHNELKEGVAKANPALLREIGASDYVEVVVAGRHRFTYRVEMDDSVPENELWVNGAELPEYGVSDNSVATVRPARRQG